MSYIIILFFLLGFLLGRMILITDKILICYLNYYLKYLEFEEEKYLELKKVINFSIIRLILLLYVIIIYSLSLLHFIIKQLIKFYYLIKRISNKISALYKKSLDFGFNIVIIFIWLMVCLTVSEVVASILMNFLPEIITRQLSSTVVGFFLFSILIFYLLSYGYKYTLKISSNSKMNFYLTITVFVYSFLIYYVFIFASYFLTYNTKNDILGYFSFLFNKYYDLKVAYNKEDFINTKSLINLNKLKDFFVYSSMCFIIFNFIKNKFSAHWLYIVFYCFVTSIILINYASDFLIFINNTEKSDYINHHIYLMKQNFIVLCLIYCMHIKFIISYKKLLRKNRIQIIKLFLFFNAIIFLQYYIYKILDIFVLHILIIFILTKFRDRISKVKPNHIFKYIILLSLIYEFFIYYSIKNKEHFSYMIQFYLTIFIFFYYYKIEGLIRYFNNPIQNKILSKFLRFTDKDYLEYQEECDKIIEKQGRIQYNFIIFMMFITIVACVYYYFFS